MMAGKYMGVEKERPWFTAAARIFAVEPATIVRNVLARDA